MSAVLDAEATVGATSVAIVPRAVIATEVAPTKAAATTPAIAIVLLGTGVVGGALLKLLDTPAAALLRLVGAANSRRQQTEPASLASRSLREQLNHQGDARDNASLFAALDAGGAAVRVIVDATASAPLASRHAEWLACGYHVVTANKALAGGELTVYRGCYDCNRDGLSWSLSERIARGFPTLNRYRREGDVPLILVGKTDPKRAVLKTDRKEQELICADVRVTSETELTV